LLLRILPPITVADLGSGEGLLSELLARRCKKVRGRDYCLRALDVRFKGIGPRLLADPTPALAPAKKEDVPLLYWSAASWGAAIALGIDRPDLVIDLPTVRAKGYAFQVELTYRAVRRGFRVVEVPIVFRDRELGTSKMSWQITAEAAWLVPQLRRGAEHLRHPAASPQGAPSSGRIDTG